MRAICLALVVWLWLTLSAGATENESKAIEVAAGPPLVASFDASCWLGADLLELDLKDYHYRERSFLCELVGADEEYCRYLHVHGPFGHVPVEHHLFFKDDVLTKQYTYCQVPEGKEASWDFISWVNVEVRNNFGTSVIETGTMDQWNYQFALSNDANDFLLFRWRGRSLELRLEAGTIKEQGSDKQPGLLLLEE